MAPRILLLGATGYTGGLIAERLAAAGLPFTAAVRDRERGRALRGKLGELAEPVVVDVTDGAALRGVVDGAGVVVNCVGPYNLLGAGVLRACRGDGRVYIDLSGEQEIVRRSLDPDADHGGCTVLHSVAFESALADLLAAGMLEPGARVRSLSSYYAFDRSRPSPGTRLTMKLAGSFPTYRLCDGRLAPAEPLGFEEEVALPAALDRTAALFMPYPEVLFFGRRYDVREAASFLLLSPAEAAFARATRGRPAPDPAAVMARHRAQRREGPGPAERWAQAFTLAVRAVDEDGAARACLVRGRDMYGLTAALVTRVVAALAAGLALPAGALTPAELPVWDDLWPRLEAEGLASAPEAVA